jgi:4-hydroxybenzoate polyprenyltransferase
MQRSTLLHLRIPFSLYLMPFFCFAVSQASNYSFLAVFISFIALHLFLYPASNGYNSYFDKDEESIGGLKTPPPVNKELLNYSLFFDTIAIGLGFILNWQFALMMAVYGFVSKAYSHPKIRLKKYPLVGLFTVIFFQGFYTYIMTIVALEGFTNTLFAYTNTIPALLCSFLLLGSYPITQVYQHNEDSKRGDKTFSRLLGIKGTFIWTAGVFLIGTSGFIYYFTEKYSAYTAMLFPLFLSPVLIFFLIWAWQIRKDETKADWKSTMQLNQLSSLCFISFFVILAFIKQT